MPVRIALIGCGNITERLALPQLTHCAGAAVAALVDINRQAAQRLAAQFEISSCPIWTDWRQMLREAEVDAVAVNLPNALHAEVVIAALRAKRHVLVEKPIALTLAEADAMVDAARKSERVFMVEQTQRFDPAHELARELLQGGTLGAVTQLRGRIGHAGPEYWAGSPASWLVDPRQSGGGALIDVGIHIADLLRWLSGKEVRRICCQAKTLQKRIPVEDNASALLEFTDGTLGSFEVSWTTRPYEVTTSFYGERGTLRTSLGSAVPVTVRYADLAGDPNQPLGDEAHPPVPASSRRGGAYAHFVECITTGAVPLVTGEEGRATLEVVLGAYESVKSGGWVTLPLARRG